MLDLLSFFRPFWADFKSKRSFEFLVFGLWTLVFCFWTFVFRFSF